MLSNCDQIQGKLARLRGILNRTHNIAPEVEKRIKTRIKELKIQRGKQPLFVESKTYKEPVLSKEEIEKRRKIQMQKELKQIEKDIYGYDM
tara:strand:+ start:146 stop:418 length:273 start_codon:yes stop_codon:yes gene_type:complete